MEKIPVSNVILDTIFLDIGIKEKMLKDLKELKESTSFLYKIKILINVPNVQITVYVLKILPIYVILVFLIISSILMKLIKDVLNVKNLIPKPVLLVPKVFVPDVLMDIF